MVKAPYYGCGPWVWEFVYAYNYLSSLLRGFWYRGSFPPDFAKNVAFWSITDREPQMFSFEICRRAVWRLGCYHRTAAELLTGSGNLRCYISWGCFRTNLYPIEWGSILVLGEVSTCFTNRSQRPEHQNSSVNLQFIGVSIENYLNLTSIFFLSTRRMKMDQTECSETSVCKIQTPENYPKERMLHSQQDESLKSRIIYLVFLL